MDKTWGGLPIAKRTAMLKATGSRQGDASKKLTEMGGSQQDVTEDQVKAIRKQQYQNRVGQRGTSTGYMVNKAQTTPSVEEKNLK